MYHASYVRFMERSRTEWLRALHMEQHETMAQGLSFVVHTLALTFKRPARLDDVLHVSCGVQRIRAAALEFYQEVRNTADDSLCCSAHVSVACIHHATMRPRRVPDSLKKALQP